MSAGYGNRRIVEQAWQPCPLQYTPGNDLCNLSPNALRIKSSPTLKTKLQIILQSIPIRFHATFVDHFDFFQYSILMTFIPSPFLTSVLNIR